MNPLDQIIQRFNERWFQAWAATPEEQRVKFVQLAGRIAEQPGYRERYADNPDAQNRELAFARMFAHALNSPLREDRELYRLLSQNEAFQAYMKEVIRRMLNQPPRPGAL